MINSDIYIMIPVGGQIDEKILLKTKKNEIINEYINKLTDTSLYECDNKVSRVLKRLNYGEVEISYYNSDNYDVNSKEWLLGNIVYTYNETTNLGILQLFIGGCSKEDSQIGDMISSNHLLIKANNTEYTLIDFLNIERALHT